MPHIVDTLIEERAITLMRSPRLWWLVKRFGYPAFFYKQAVDLVDGLQGLGGFEVMDRIAKYMSLDISISGIENVPRQGGAVIMANHPSGIADGVAVFAALKERRPDICFFANRDSIRCLSGLADIVVPVEWREEFRSHQKSKETVRALSRACKDNRLIVIFPSGRLAKPTCRGLRERDWLVSGTALAKRYQMPIIPMRIQGRNTLLYYLLYSVNKELRDLTLFRELLHPAKKRFSIHVGKLVTIDDDLEELTTALRDFVSYTLSDAQPDFLAYFNPADELPRESQAS